MNGGGPGHNTTDFSWVPQGDGRLVTWVMTGPMPLVSKQMLAFVSLDRLIGKDVEADWATMKAVAEEGVLAGAEALVGCAAARPVCTPGAPRPPLPQPVPKGGG